MQSMKTLFMAGVLIAVSTLTASAVVPRIYNTTNTLVSEVRLVFKKENTQPIRLIFVGDIMLDRYIRTTNESSGYENILRTLSPILQQGDFVIGNLEGPVTKYPSKSSGTLPAAPDNFVFTFSPDALGPLHVAGIDAFSIGNNHILNFGTDGLEQTKKYLQEVGIEYFGEPYTHNVLIKNFGDTSVGFIAFNEFLPFDEEQLVQSIQSLSDTVDFVVVYAHWGSEYETTANALQQRLSHRFIDSGADVVVGSHPHVIQNVEVYQGKTIYYSLGNFIFDQYWMDSVRCGALITLTLTPPDMTYTVEESSVWLEKNGSTVPSGCMSKIRSSLPSV